MKKYIIQYKPFLFFLGKFFFAYIILTLSYQAFLGNTTNDSIDGVTKNVALLTADLANLFGIKITTFKDSMHYNIIYHDKVTARIIEGCNAVSVIILFISFVISFSGKFKQTMLFILCGSLIIYGLNIIRIAVLSVLMYYYPDQEHVLHGVIFPLIIYGAVFILWVIWVTKFSKYASKVIK